MTPIPAEFASSAQVKRSCCPELIPERNEVSATTPKDSLLAATEAVAEQLNLGCFCISLDRKELGEALDRAVRIEGFAQRLSASHPTLFSNVPVFVPSATLGKMMLIVDAVEDAAQLPAYRAAALSYAPPSAQLDFGPVGAFMGYDFHLASDGPKLIEINTNAGGAFLNAFLAGAQHACCPEAEFQVRPLTESDFAERTARMFTAEWQLQRGGGQPALVAIVDDLPEQQHLYPEFQLAKEMLEGQGSKAAYRGDKLTRRVWHEIVRGEYVAQAFAAPTARNATLAGESIVLKTDIRLYAYAGELLLAAARLYQGQTTNMRTAGGGFAPVLEVTDPVSCLEQACGQVP